VKRLLFILIFVTAAFAANGSFTGQVVNGPSLDANKKWVFVQGPRGPLRRVDVSGAKVTFSDAVMKKDKSVKPEDSIREGAELRVTAFQDAMASGRRPRWR
jgi:hypothetical protein